MLIDYYRSLIGLATFLAFVFNAKCIKAQVRDTTRPISVIQYCISHEDLINNRWTEIEIDKPAFARGEKETKGAVAELSSFLQDKSVRKKIGKKALAVKCDSTLMLNLQFLHYGLVGSMGRDFAQAYPLKDGRYVITYYDVSKIGGMNSMGAMGGAMGVAMMSTAIENVRSNNVCYLFTPGTNKVVRIKNEVLKNLLGGRDELFDEYLKVSRYQRNFECIILPLLKRANVFR